MSIFASLTLLIQYSIGYTMGRNKEKRTASSAVESRKPKKAEKNKNKSRKKIDSSVATATATDGGAEAASSPVTPIRTVKTLSYLDSPPPTFPVDSGSEGN